MTWREAVIAGTPGRVFRISFSGELAFELNVPTWHGLALWEAVMAAGEPLGITPYGTETMHVLRAEKGYPIIGQETDGTVTPQDLGHGVGRVDEEGLHRPAVAPAAGRPRAGPEAAGRPAAGRPGGAAARGRPARRTRGRSRRDARCRCSATSTSSYRSAALGRTFALALVKGGRDRIGQRVLAPLVDGTVEATIVDSVVFDPENARATGSPPRDGDRAARASPLEGVELPARVRELPFLAQLDLRADPSDAALMARLTDGRSVPARRPSRTPRRLGRRHAATCCGWAPTSGWSSGGAGHGAGARARPSVTAIGDGRGAVVDVSANRTTLSVSGPRARDLLAFGCSIDLDERRSSRGMCAQTLLARANVIIVPVGPAVEPPFRVLVRPSFAAYLAAWLTDAAVGLD